MDFENHCKICQRSTHCCIFKKKEGFAFIGIKNAEIIKQKIKKDYSEFLDYSPLPKKIVDAMKNEDFYLEGAMRFDLLDSKNRLLRLKIKENEHCIFLNDKRLCDIYDIRPNICRIYPFWAIRLLNRKLKVIRHDEHPKCSIIKELQKEYNQGKYDKSEKQKKFNTDADLEKVLSKNRIEEVKSTMINIEKENTYYKKNIEKFVEKAKLNITPQ